MSTSNAVSNVLGNFGGQLGLVNTGTGMKSALVVVAYLWAHSFMEN
jgi:hypothetical protein